MVVEEEEEDSFKTNMTEDTTQPSLHEDSPLPKKEPLEMLAKAGTKGNDGRECYALNLY